jgi:hypothetical protein
VTVLPQAAAGLALAVSFALLAVRRPGPAFLLLAVQSAAAALSAIAAHQPALAIPPVLLAFGAWTLQRLVARPPAPPPKSIGLPVGLGVALAILCQSQGAFALPLAVMLLAVLLAAARPHPLSQVLSLVALQNGAVLTACLVRPLTAGPEAALAVACFALPLPLTAVLLIRTSSTRSRPPGVWLAWLDLAASLAVTAATLLVPLDPTAFAFAPLLALDGVMRSWQRRTRTSMARYRRGLSLLTGLFPVLAVCSPQPVVAWLAVLAAITAAVLPTIARRWNHAVLAFQGAGVALCGLLALGPFVPAYLAVFAGFAAIAASVPDLAAVLVCLILRLADQAPWPVADQAPWPVADQAPWPVAAQALGSAVALLALLACAARLRGKSPRAAINLLQLSQAAIAALAISLGQPDGRFAALMLLMLLILSRAATRAHDGPVADLAIAGLAGVPPLGVFPGLVLVVLATITRSAWLLLPMGIAAVPILRASLPRNLPSMRLTTTIPSLGWLPLALALLTGYFAPQRLVLWWHMLTTGAG